MLSITAIRVGQKEQRVLKHWTFFDTHTWLSRPGNGRSTEAESEVPNSRSPLHLIPARFSAWPLKVTPRNIGICHHGSQVPARGTISIAERGEAGEKNLLFTQRKKK